MTGMLGKILRHGTGALVGALIAAIVAFFAARGVLFDAGQVVTTTQLLTDGLVGFIFLFGAPIFTGLLSYAGVEKWLKRFKALDKEGWIDRLWLKHEAATPSTDTKVLQNQASIE